jgi:hypothetical protein
MPLQQDRRQFLRSTGIVLTVAVGSQAFWLSPREARAANLPHRVLDKEQVATLEGLAEALVPGSRAAGISHFVDAQLAAASEDCLLMLKYLGVPASDFRGFYRGGLGSAARLADDRFSKSWSTLSGAEAESLLTAMDDAGGPEWTGPPAGFFLFVVRSDACDVVYGTPAGFARLDVPYLAHIEPKDLW